MTLDRTLCSLLWVYLTLFKGSVTLVKAVVERVTEKYRLVITDYILSA